jgi:hypothetical protein
MLVCGARRKPSPRESLRPLPNSRRAETGGGSNGGGGDDDDDEDEHAVAGKGRYSTGKSSPSLSSSSSRASPRRRGSDTAVRASPTTPASASGPGGGRRTRGAGAAAESPRRGRSLLSAEVHADLESKHEALSAALGSLSKARSSSGSVGVRRSLSSLRSSASGRPRTISRSRGGGDGGAPSTPTTSDGGSSNGGGGGGGGGGSRRRPRNRQATHTMAWALGAGRATDRRRRAQTAAERGARRRQRSHGTGGRQRDQLGRRGVPIGTGQWGTVMPSSRRGNEADRTGFSAHLDAATGQPR